MPAKLGCRALALALVPLVVASSSTAGPPNPCQAGSVPYTQCNFAKGQLKCYGGVNTGQNADPGNNICTVPGPGNDCEIVLDPKIGAWMWASQRQGKECCNCFMGGEKEWATKSDICPSGSVPFKECHFMGGKFKCKPGVNTGALAEPRGKNAVCTVPGPTNNCNMVLDEDLFAWTWWDQTGGVECCNCFQLEDAFPQSSGAPASRMNGGYSHYNYGGYGGGGYGGGGYSGGGHYNYGGYSGGGYGGGYYLAQKEKAVEGAEAAAAAKGPALAAVESHEDATRRNALKSRLRRAAAEHDDEATAMLQLPAELLRDDLEEGQEGAEL